MGLIAQLRGLIGATGAQGPVGVVGLFAATNGNPWVVNKSNPAISFSTSTGVATFLVAGWYAVNVGGKPALQAANSTLKLPNGSPTFVFGPY